MSNSLVIVESPAKAKTIEKYLNEIDKKKFIVKSSIGHIRDLKKSEMSIDIENGFIPQYEISSDKKKTVSELKKLVKEAETIWLATDEDREGEAIAWHLYEALKLKDKNTKRIVFHEITKKAIQAAIENPRNIDKNLVDAQQARRVLDRLVGYELSPVLWKKVKYGLSAGRVQSVTVRLIVEREKEIKAFIPEVHYKTEAFFNLDDGTNLKSIYNIKIFEKEKATELLNNSIDKTFLVKDLEKKPGTKSPAPPFTTSTLTQEASRKLGYSVKQTMVLAQKLYESGKITYMRTDSTNLSDFAIDMCAKEIAKRFESSDSQRRVYQTKSKGAQEAHEAIRPTDMSIDEPTDISDNGMKSLYKLIWRRTIASQMKNAEIEKTTVKIGYNGLEGDFIAKGEIITYKGFLKAYSFNDDSDDSKMLPPLELNQDLSLDKIVSRESFSRPPARYTEASLVNKLEEMGIGRPSTYAPTISTILDRGYVVKEDRDGEVRKFNQLTLKNKELKDEIAEEITGKEVKKLFPTDTGTVVTEFLEKFFEKVVDYNFTRNVEEEFDAISEGKTQWNKMISDFYNGFHKTIEDSESISRKDAIQARLVGNDPKTGKPIYARIGRFGAMLQLGETEDEEKPKFASLLPTQSMDTITLEEALEQFKLPRLVGTTEDGKKILANNGRFGPYVNIDKTYASITLEQLYSISKEEALELIEEKLKGKAKNTIQEWEGEDVKVLNGRFGPYITNGKKNVKIPKDKEPEKITLEECKELIEKAPEKKRGGFRRKK